MLLVTGESRFADLLERTLYNGFLSGHSLDGESFFYVNPLQSRERRAPPPLEPGRVLPAEHHAAARVAAPLPRHGPSDAASSSISTRRRRSAPLSGRRPRRARRRDGLPVVGRDRRSRWSRRDDAEWTLSLRVPAWARGGDRRRRAGRAGQLRGADAALARRATASMLELDVSPRLTAPNPRIDAVRGCVALERGPIVYCVEAARPSGRRRSRRRRARRRGRPRRQRSDRAARRRARAWRWRASSATSTAGGRPSIATSGAAGGRRRRLRRGCSPFPTSRGRTGDEGGMRVWIPRRTGARRRLWRPCRSSS